MFEEENELNLEIVDVSCTEVWLKVKKAYDEKLELFRNDSLVNTYNLKQPDTIIIDTGLLPSQEYNYKITNNGQSTRTKAITMDTTSHNFSWQTWTFGEHSSSVLNSVAIIDESNIWAVGEIYMNDSIGQPDNKIYNAIHWNGNEWELKRIYVDYKGKPNLAPLEGIFTFDDGNVVFTSGHPYIPQNDGWKLYHLWDMNILNNDDGGVTNIWGTSLNNLYFVGRKGTIVHYNGQGWTKIESGTNTNLTDIWGYKDEVWVCGWQNDGNSVLLKIIELNVETIWESSDVQSGYVYRDYLSTLWANENKAFYVSGNGFFYMHSLIDKSYSKKYPIDLGGFIYSLRGNNSNDIILAGDKSAIWHWNGNSWQNYPEHYFQSNRLYNVDYKEKVVCTVGYINNESPFRKGLLIVGKHN